MFTDPNGHFFWIPVLVGAIIGGTINLGIQMFSGKIHNGWDALAAFGIGALAGGLSMAVPQLIPGLTTAAQGALMPGFIPGFTAGFTGGFSTSFGNELYFNHSSVSDAALKGLKTGLISGSVGGLLNGISAVNHDRNFFTGGRNGGGTSCNPYRGSTDEPIYGLKTAKIKVPGVKSKLLDEGTNITDPVSKSITDKNIVINFRSDNPGDAGVIGKFTDDGDPVTYASAGYTDKAGNWIPDPLARGGTPPISGEITYSFTPASEGVSYSYKVIKLFSVSKTINIPYWFRITNW
jgi:hypothetical protein